MICSSDTFCEHKRKRARCKECGGSQICEHGRRKTDCIDCRGNAICEHNRIIYRCRDCKGGSYCKHDKRRSMCFECGGSYYCIHRRLKQNCVECHGTSICPHNKRKSRCPDCNGTNICKTPLCPTYANPKYEGYCMPCFVNNPENRDKAIIRNYKTKERAVATAILECYPNFTWKTDKAIEGGCSNRRPDLLLDMGSHVVIVEVDEDQHTDYDCSCENKRLMQISQDIQHRPLIFIRFNPDTYLDETGAIITSCWRLNQRGVMSIVRNKEREWKERLSVLMEQIQYWVENPTEKMVEVVELFYNRAL
jgi:hypothetical protein